MDGSVAISNRSVLAGLMGRWCLSGFGSGGTFRHGDAWEKVCQRERAACVKPADNALGIQPELGIARAAAWPGVGRRQGVFSDQRDMGHKSMM